MSAYLCDDAHFATLAVAYAEITGMPPDFAQDLADALKLANLRSVNHLYREDAPFTGCTLAQHQARTRTPAELMAMLDCWEYQSCERPGWQGSQIQQLGQAMRAQFVAYSLATGRGATRAPNVWSIDAPFGSGPQVVLMYDLLLQALTACWVSQHGGDEDVMIPVAQFVRAADYALSRASE